MKKLCKFRCVVELTTSKRKYTLHGGWHYRYLEEEIPQIRNEESQILISDFGDACKRADKMWPCCYTGTSLIRGKPYIGILDSDRIYTCDKVYRTHFVGAKQRSEYVIVSPDECNIIQLAQQLPADEFVEFVATEEVRLVNNGLVSGIKG